MRLDIHCQGVDLSNEAREHIERRLEFALTRFEPRMMWAAVYLSDQSGPHGGVGKRCRVLVRLRRHGEVIVEEDGEDLNAAVARAADRVGQAMAREMDRRNDARHQASVAER